MTADRIIDVLLAANLAGSLAVLAVLLLRGPIRRLAGARLAYMAWLIVPAAILAVFLPARTIETPALPPTPSPAAAAIELLPATGFSIEQPATHDVAEAAGIPGAASAMNLDWTLLLAIVWAAGALAALVFLIVRQLLAIRALGPLTPLSPTTSRATRSEIGPAVVGVLAPRIVLPANFEDAFNDAERKVVLAHEEAHLRGRHTAVKTIVEIAVCLSWFNPLAYLAARAIAMDQELACDEAVAARYPHDRKAYAGALLKTQAGPRLPLGCYWPAQSARRLKTRIARLGLAAPGRNRRIAGAALVLVCGLGAGLTAWAAKPAEERYTIARDVEPPTSFSVSDVQPDEPGILRETGPRNGPENASAPAPQIPDSASAPSAAIDTSDVRQIIANGGTASDVAAAMLVKMLAKNPPQPGSRMDFRYPDPATAKFVRGQEGMVCLAWLGPRGAVGQLCGEDMQTYVPPGGKASLPSIAETFPKPALQPIFYDPQQTPAQRAFEAGFDSLDPVYLRGKVEKIEFRDTTYVVFVRASAIAAGERAPASASTSLWELSPTHYWGDRDAVNADLMSKSVAVRGYKAIDKTCAPACRMHVQDIRLAKSTALPPLSETPAFSAIDFAVHYDTATRYARTLFMGRVQRVEFGDRTFDIYVQTGALDENPNWTYQVRSEYRHPRADIEKLLLNQEIVVAGWPAKRPMDTVLQSPVGVFGTDFELANGMKVTPAGDKLLSEAPRELQLGADPDARPFIPPGFAERVATFDMTAMVTIEGKIVRADAESVWVEAEKFDPVSMPGATPGAVWRVMILGGGTSNIGNTITVRGWAARDKSCQPTCLMESRQSSIR